MADGWGNFPLNVSETKHATKHLTTDITIALKVFIKNSKGYGNKKIFGDLEERLKELTKHVYPFLYLA